MITNRKTEGKEFILEDFAAPINKINNPGLDFGLLVLKFKNLEDGELVVGNKITTDFRDGQYLNIVRVNKNELEVTIDTKDPKEYLNIKNLQEGIIYYKL